MVVRDIRWFRVALVIGVLWAAWNMPLGCAQRIKADVREALAPIEQLFSGIGQRWDDAVRAARGLGSAASELETLRRETTYARQRLRRLEHLEVENARLREALDFRRRSSFDLMACEVIARDISGWWQTARVGKGINDGIQTNAAVINAEGLVGRTHSVSRETADILLLSDPLCRVSVLLSRSGAMGVLQGSGTPSRDRVTCVLKFVSRGALVRVGDEVMTSGLGGVFPTGLLVGYIEKVEMDKTGLYQEAVVLPAADLRALYEVFVVREAGAGEARP